MQVTCPGVCLCPSGDIEVSLICLQHHFRTLPQPPRFPILLHETFTVSGFYRDDFTHREHFERTLRREPLECNFWQNGRRLAHSKGALADLLGSNGIRSMHSNENGEVPCELLLKPSTCFPGIIGPKCVMRVVLDVVERDYKSSSSVPSSVSIPNCRPHRSHSCRSSGDHNDESTSPLSTTATVAHTKKCRRLQKPVCHVRQRAARFVSGSNRSTIW